MPYPGQFHHLVMIGNLFAEKFNMTLNIVPSALGELGMPAVDATTLAAVAGDVATWFPKTTAAGGCGFTTFASLTSIKLNRIGADGKYVDNIAQEYIYPTPVAGPLSLSVPAQNAGVVSLRTRLERGRGSKGRIYLIPSGNMHSVGADGRVAASTALAAANGVRTLVQALNSRYVLIGRVGVASNAGLGRFEHVTYLSAGRVPDTMRSRRSSLVEDYQDTSPV